MSCRVGQMNQNEKKMKILYAEDDDALHIVVSSVLGNYQIIAAAKAVTAIELINTAGFEIDGIICDFNFRDELLTGYDIYKAIKSKYPTKPFFLFSSVAKETQNLFDSSNDFILEKPGGIRQLKSILDKYFLKR